MDKALTFPRENLDFEAPIMVLIVSVKTPRF